MDEKNNANRGSQRSFWKSILKPRGFIRRYIRGRKKNLNTKIASEELDVTLHSTDIGAQIMHDSGMELRTNKSLEKLITEREYGIIEFSNSYKRQIACKFLPNQLVSKLCSARIPYCGVFSKEGDYFFSGRQGGKIIIYKPGPYQLIKSDVIFNMRGQINILDIASNSDTSKLIYTSWSDKLYMVDFVQPGKPQQLLDLDLGVSHINLLSAVFSPDDKDILGGFQGGLVFLYNLETMQSSFTTLSHYPYDANTVSFADESSCIFITGGNDGICKVWDRRTSNESKPQPVGVFAGHHDGIAFIDAKKDGRCFLSNSHDHTIKLWDIRKFSSYDENALNTQRDLSRRNWPSKFQTAPIDTPRLPGDTSLMTYRRHDIFGKTLIRARFSPMATTGQKYIYCGSENGKIHVYDLLTGKTVSILDGHSDCVRDVHWHPYSPNLASSSLDRSVGYWTYSGDSKTSDQCLTELSSSFEHLTLQNRQNLN